MMTRVSALTVLERELYSVNEAARLLTTPNRKVHPTTLRRWLEGGSRKGVEYAPVLRPEPTGSDSVTWAEFVEAGLLAQFRRSLSLQRLRPLIVALRREFGVPYPLAHFRPLIDPGSKQVVLDLQRELGTPKSLWLVLQPRSGRGSVEGFQSMIWSPAVEAHLQTVHFDEAGRTVRMQPLGDGTSVVIDPAKSFGIPTIAGIRTETIAELVWAGEPVTEVARDFDLTVDQVGEALRWESRIAAA